MMKIVRQLTAALLTAAVTIAPAAADPGRGNGNGHGKGGHVRKTDDHGHNSRRRSHAHTVADCPPGLAKKEPACVPPGQARKHYGTRTGDTLHGDNYVLIRDLSRYGLQPRQGWDYYRSNDQIYGVDRRTKRILAVLNLIDAFSR